MRKIFLLLFCLAFASGCSTLKKQDDAVRIKPERAPRYEKAPDAVTMRDGRTLRGTVVEVQIAPNPEIPNRTDTTVIFLNQGVADKKENYERIPIQDVELVATLFNTPKNEYGNINVFESFNRTENIPYLRTVPVKIFLPTDCGCQPLTMDLSIQPPSIKCPDREYSWLFVETRGIYSLYNDTRVHNTTEIGREALQGEIATGFRFWGNYGLGLAYTSPLYAYNSFKSIDMSRPTVLLHGRAQLTNSVTNFLGICMKPFFYAQFGATIDEASVNLFKVNFAKEDCDDCNKLIGDLKANAQLGDVDFTLPITWGFGAGIDIPMMSSLDLSFDLGWRRQGFAEEVAIAGFESVPTYRSIDVFRLRMGLTY